MSKFQTALVIGGGAFGTSIATVLANNFARVIVKVRSEKVYQDIKTGENTTYLPNQELASNIIPALSWQEIDSLQNESIELVVMGLPTAAIKGYLKENYQQLLNYLHQEIPFVSLAKGIDCQTLELPDDLFFEHFAAYRDLFTFLSGPSFAREIVDKQITLVSLAGRSKRVLEKVFAMLQTNYFKALYNYDIKGVLLGGALKNILAIAGGIIEGLGHNHNTRAAMISRGIQEMLRFGNIFNARPETFYGLSGMGDLILTTTGGLSRNKHFGLELAKGKTVNDVFNAGHPLVEGYKTSKAAYLLSQKYDIRASIFNGVYQVLFENQGPRAVIERLMQSPTMLENGHH